MTDETTNIELRSTADRPDNAHGVTLPDPRVTPTLDIETAGRVLGWGRSTSYQAARSGQLPTISISARRRRVPTAALWKMLGMSAPADN